MKTLSKAQKKVQQLLRIAILLLGVGVAIIIVSQVIF